jgi:hypothetical protein
MFNSWFRFFINLFGLSIVGFCASMWHLNSLWVSICVAIGLFLFSYMVFGIQQLRKHG